MIRTSPRWWVLLWNDYGWFLIDFRFFVKIHRSGLAIIFSCWTIMEHVSYPSKKLLRPHQDDEYYSGRIMDGFWSNYWFSIFSSNFTEILTILMKSPYPTKDLIKMVSITLEELWMVSDRIIDFRFFVKFHRPDLQ